MIEQLVAAGRRPSVAFEQLDIEDQPAVDGVVAAGGDADSLAREVEWERSGWPAFEMYRPIFEAALRKKLPIRAANVSRAWLHTHAASIEPEVPLPARLRRAMADEIAESHCGYSNEHMTAAMIRMQRLRDERMARALIDAGPDAVLIAGLEHARRDRGVPLYLRHYAPRIRVLSLAFAETPGDAVDPRAVVAELGDVQDRPFDYVWFTPRIERPDPCVEFRKQLERMRERR